MVNQEHLEILNKGVGVWNEWRQRAYGPIDLRAADLSNRDLSGVDFGVRRTLSVSNPSFTVEKRLASCNLEGADLSGSTLTSARLIETNLVGANLRGAVFAESVLIRANLANADLRDSYLIFTNLESANLPGANLQGTTLRGVIFVNTYLTDAVGLEHCRHLGPSSIDLWTLRTRPDLPTEFLRGCGAPETLIEYLPSVLGTPIEFYSCFLSYSHADTDFADRLFDALQSRGVRCWRDVEHLLPGDDIYEGTDRGIRLWDKTLLCCSENSLHPTSWVDKEIITALEKEHELTKRQGVKVQTLIPLDLDGYIFSDGWRSGYRAEIRRRLAADFTGWINDQRKFGHGVEELIRALRADAGAREKPPRSRL